MRLRLRLRPARERTFDVRGATEQEPCAAKKRRVRRGRLTPLLTLALLGLSTGSASASTSLNLPQPLTKFDFCPASDPSARHCLYLLGQGGSVTLGKKTVPLVRSITLQGAYGPPQTEEIVGGVTYEHISQFFAATNGESLSKTPEPVPGGLLGLVPPAASPPSVRQLAAYYNEHNASAVTATAELAGEMLVSEFELLVEELPTARMPIKIHLENPFLGSSCYIGSNSSPIIWNLTAGMTAPPAPNKPIHGHGGAAELEGGPASLEGVNLVDNAWSAPVATGCGGTLAPIVDPLIDAAIGLPSPAGRNTAIISNIYLSDAAAKEIREQ
jgi:hypothetical protein